MSENVSGKESRGLSPAALLVAGAFFMEFLDGTVIATALPDMAKSFGDQAVDLNIGISAYLITLAVLIPASGWIADRFGARKVFAPRWRSSRWPRYFAACPPRSISSLRCASSRAWVAR